MNKVLRTLILLGYVTVYNNPVIADSNNLPTIDGLKLTAEKAYSDVTKELSEKYYINQSRNFNFSSNEQGLDNEAILESMVESFVTDTNEDSALYYQDKASQLLDIVKSENRFIDKLDSAAVISLPVGIRTEIAGLEYIILIDEVSFRPDGAYFDAFMSFETPQGKKLAFKGLDIPFSFSGGLKGDVRLELVTPIKLNFGEGIDLVIKGDGGSYVVWDCYGFKQMGIAADVIFSRDLIVPEDQAGNVIAGNVATSFAIEMSDWNNLLVSINMPAFQVAGVEGVGFTITNAVFDFSDYQNFASIRFPQGYTSTYFVATNTNLWRGVYIQQASVRLPEEFGADGVRTSFNAYDLLIDEQGFSGKLIAENILSLEKGKMGNWAFSLDKIGVELTANQLTKAGFEGLVQVPIIDKEHPLKYTALIDMGGEYAFTISPTDNVKFDVWSADVNLKPTSYIDIRVVDHEFQPKAVLNGNASIKLSDGGVELADLSFETLEIKSTAPYVSVGAFSFGSEALQQKTANFPVSIQNIAFHQVSDNKIGIGFNLILNLVGEGDGGFGADCGLMIVGEMAESGGIQSWRYSYLELTKIAVNISGGAYKIAGSLEFFKNDQYYGDGFKGTADIEIINMVKIQGMALFGKVDGYRYWYADAMATFSSGIPLGAFSLNKFGGGVFHHMRQLDLTRILVVH